MKIATTLLMLVFLSLWVAGSAATPAACADDCEIPSHSFGYVPPLFEVASGASVVWTSLDTIHVTADGAAGGDAGTCFFVDHHTTFDSIPVRFDFDGSTLTATADGRTSECGGVDVLPSGAALLQYFCVLHPNMRGALLVSA